MTEPTPYSPPYYIQFSFVLQSNAQVLDPNYESQRAKGLVERILGRDYVWEWEIVELKGDDYEPVNP